MPISMRATVIGDEEWIATLRRLSPERHKEIIERSLLECAYRVQTNAQTKQILPGGHGPPDPRQLTSRTGTLRRSITVNRRPLPKATEIGSDLVYGPVHELGINMPRRPFLEPALDEEEERFPEIFMKEWRKIARV